MVAAADSVVKAVQVCDCAVAMQLAAELAVPSLSVQPWTWSHWL